MQKLLKKEFRLSWEDITGDPDAGKSNEHETDDKARELSRGIGRSNVQMVILTPDGRLLHAVTGYVRAKELQWELEQALDSWEAVKKAAESAELQVQRRALATRQEAIQTAWLEEFGPKRKKGQAAPARTWQSRQSEHDREILRENPMVHAGTVTTRMLTGGPGTHFGYGKSDEAGERTPTTNEIRKRLGAPLVRETEADKRVRKRREKAAARNKVPARPAPARPAGGRTPLR